MLANRHGVTSHMTCTFNTLAARNSDLTGLSGLTTSWILFCNMTPRLVLDKVELQQYSKYFTSVSPTSQHSTEASHPSVINSASVLHTFHLNYTGSITVIETTRHKKYFGKGRSSAIEQHSAHLITWCRGAENVDWCCNNTWLLNVLSARSDSPWLPHSSTFNTTFPPHKCFVPLTLILLTWTIWRAPTNASKWQMGFNSSSYQG